MSSSSSSYVHVLLQ